MKKRLSEAWKKSAHFYQKEIWQPGPVSERRARRMSFAALRVLSTTWTVFLETKAPSRAAALSFSSLLGIAPCIALAVLIAGVVLGQQDPEVAINRLNRVFHYFAPQVAMFESSRTQGGDGTPAAAATVDGQPAANMNLAALMDNFIVGAKSGRAGALGAFSLVLVVLLLFKSIEDAFNEIWGVRKGRSWLTRIIFYWSIFTLGAVLFVASVTGLGVGAVATAVSRLPVANQFSTQIVSIFRYLVPAASTLLLYSLLTVFYRTIPNTKVLWRAAAIGGAAATALLTLNNFMTFLYVQRVFLAKSLYGSVALPLILLSSLYIFWLYVLSGGIISYAVQNVHFRSSQAAWSRLNESQRERLSLVVLLTICRRFQACLPPVSSLQLSTMTKVPTQILNECLSRLVDMKLIAALDSSEAGSTSVDTLYQPARPLNRITLFDFKVLDDNLGESPMGDTLERLDPILRIYSTALNQLGKEALFQKSLEELFGEHPFDESRPPFQRLA